MKKLYLGKKLKQLRILLDYTQFEMAEHLGLSQSYYAAIETSKRPITQKILSNLSQKWEEWNDIFNDENGGVKKVSNMKYMGGYYGGINEGKDFENKLYLHYRIPSIANFDYKVGDSKTYMERFFQKVNIPKNKEWDLVAAEANESLRKIGIFYQRILDVKILIFNELNIGSTSRKWSVEKEAEIMHSVVGGHIAEGKIRIDNSYLPELKEFNEQLYNVANFFEKRFLGLFKLLYTGLRMKHKEDADSFKHSYLPDSID